MAAAEASTTLRLGTLVLDINYRHLALLAKEVATLDLLSEGRFELGLGVGWIARESHRNDLESISRLIETAKHRRF
jgi:alkanesulfonate monooxygenase SsuD/methylene tetrahydromethanopterin reductase-like flavin-dependent oxidoreductase (luciferase family)